MITFCGDKKVYIFAAICGYNSVYIKVIFIIYIKAAVDLGRLAVFDKLEFTGDHIAWVAIIRCISKVQIRIIIIIIFIRYKVYSVFVDIVSILGRNKFFFYHIRIFIISDDYILHSVAI